MKPPFPYYGGKLRLAPWILSFMPPHKTYVEPFGGSAAVLLAKQPSRYEVFNDLNGDVVNFWRVLRDRHDELVDVLQLTPYARDEYLQCLESPSDGVSDLERARRFFVHCCAAFNASAHASKGFSFSVPAKLGKPRTFVRRIDERIAAVAERLRCVEIENYDAVKVINRWRRPDTVLYLDPPYEASTRVAHGPGYATEAGATEFHRGLIDAVRDFPGTVLLSGYAGVAYEDLDWRCETRVVAAHTSNVPGQRRTECLWIKPATV